MTWGRTAQSHLHWFKADKTYKAGFLNKQVLDCREARTISFTGDPRTMRNYTACWFGEGLDQTGFTVQQIDAKDRKEVYVNAEQYALKI